MKEMAYLVIILLVVALIGMLIFAGLRIRQLKKKGFWS